MRCWSTREDFLPTLTAHLASRYRVVAPLTCADGGVRLNEVVSPAQIVPGAQAMLSLKKFLFPHAQELCRQPERDASSTTTVPPRLAALALPPCDLQAVALLDQALGEDPDYRRQREGLLLIGAACWSQSDCYCQVPETFPWDLFLTDTQLWAASAAGEQIAAQLTHCLVARDVSWPPPGLLPSRHALPADLEERLDQLADAPLWDTPSGTCLACGACSAVCPTCFCYDLRDQTFPGAPNTRQRRWDNCLFSNFALVAGGHDFRPGIRSRLQFRMQHKLLGFGELKGTTSCVGCNRCARFCPADIGPGELLAHLHDTQVGP